MYEVVKFFTDLQDHNFPYHPGDKFPRDGREVSRERLQELSGNQNKQKTPLIREVAPQETKPVKEEPVAEKAETTEKEVPQKEKTARPSSKKTGRSKK